VYGVAKGANIVSVKILDDQGLGTSDALVAGINWVVADRRVANHRYVQRGCMLTQKSKVCCKWRG
jgi:subtilisin family serine protease